MKGEIKMKNEKIIYEEAKLLADELKKELDEASNKVAHIISDDKESDFKPEGM